MKAGPELDALIEEKVMGGFTDPIPPYSTDIAAAWLVVEKLDLLQRYGQYLCRDTWGKWVIIEYEGEFTSTVLDAPTAPLAICLAALKAVGAV